MKKLWNHYSYAIILLILSFLTTFILFIQISGPEDTKYKTITIGEGDTLWQIAEQYSGEHNLSAKEFVHWVEQKNGILGERIFPGDELIIPVSTPINSQTELASSQ